METFQAGPYQLRWGKGVRATPFTVEPDYHGISFEVDATKYDVVVNRLMGLRLHITRTDALGFLRDMPFNLNTAGLLPPGIEVSTR